MQAQFFSELNHYETIGKIGSGTTSEVFLVRNPADGKVYAMKVGAEKELLRQESDLLKNLKHPALPAWKEYYEEEKGHLIMEYVEGITLQKWIEKHGKASEFLAGNIICEILQLLQFLHDRSTPIIYCDIKPANIMVDKKGGIRLIDLGSAVKSRFKVGTYGYAAPEQFWEGIEPGPECDIYAVGKLLAFLLTGKDPCIPPYDMLQFCEKDRGISAGMYEVIQRSIAVNSLGRYTSATEFEQAVHSVLRDKNAGRLVFAGKKEKIEYEKCVWRSEYQRIF